MTPASGWNVNTTLREDNGNPKRQLCEVKTILAKTMDSLEEVRAKHKLVLHSNGNEKERQMKQEMLALETFVRY